MPDGVPGDPRRAFQFLDAGAYQIVMESEGITETVPEMRTGRRCCLP
jgi:hypothetical protein